MSASSMSRIELAVERWPTDDMPARSVPHAALSSMQALRQREHTVSAARKLLKSRKLKQRVQQTVAARLEATRRVDDQPEFLCFAPHSGQSSGRTSWQRRSEQLQLLFARRLQQDIEALCGERCWWLLFSNLTCISWQFDTLGTHRGCCETRAEQKGEKRFLHAGNRS